MPNTRTCPACGMVLPADAPADGTARLWPVDPLPTAQARTPRELSAAERERFEIEKRGMMGAK